MPEDNAAAYPSTLQVRRMLVVGVGSTGLRICEQLAEHLTWQYGDFESVTWVRLLVLETAQPKSILGQRVLYGGMSMTEYNPYLEAPRATGADFGFAAWHDEKTLRSINDLSAGAGNCRMLGRLCLYHRRTYDLLRRRVEGEIGELKKLTAQSAKEKLGATLAERQIAFIEEDTLVYVVGTLCGGTGSGGCADLGYLLSAWTGNSVKRQAIFTLPHPTLGGAMAPRYKKNAYYALKELNHFMLSEHPWEQLLPGSDTPHRYEQGPYDILRVVMPPTATDVRGLESTIAQYLAATAGPAGEAVAAADSNALGKLVGGEAIGFMRPRFSTMGIASLEYPGEHIQRAASDRLLYAAYDRWRRATVTPELFQAALAKLGGADFESLLQRVGSGSDRTYIEIQRQTFRPIQEGQPPRVEEVRQMLRDVNGRLTTYELPKDGLVGNVVPLLLTMENNLEAFEKRIAQDVREFVNRYLFDVDAGPRFVIDVLGQFLRHMEAWAESAQNQLPVAEDDTKTLRAQIDAYLAELEALEKQGWFDKVFGRRKQLDPRWHEVVSKVEHYFKEEIKTQTIGYLQRRNIVREMVEQYKRATALPLRRLAVLDEAYAQLAARHGDAWRERATAAPRANGKVLFEAHSDPARGTVAEVYYQMLRLPRYDGEPVDGWGDPEKETAAIRAVVGTLTPLRDEIYKDDGSSAFDVAEGGAALAERVPSRVREAAEARARLYFAPLRDRIHIAGQTSAGDVDSLVEMSEPRLEIAPAMASYVLAGERGERPFEADLAFLSGQLNAGVTASQIDAIQQRIKNQMPLTDNRVTNNGDPYRLLLIRDRHGFTLGQMKGVVKSSPHDVSALEQAEDCRDFPYWHTRRDVNWTDPLIRRDDVERAEENLLFTLLLGRPAADALTWLPASRGLIEEAGWYRVADGQFFVPYIVPSTGVAGDSGSKLPLSFKSALGLSLSPEQTLLSGTLRTRVSSFRARHGAQALVDAIHESLPRLSLLGLGPSLTTKQADQIRRRAFRRDRELADAFFTLTVGDREGNPEEFARLWREEGYPIEGRPEERYGASGYYCPDCHYFLGAKVGELLQQHFECPACNNGKRYWP
jgi:hypothetical protein